MIAAAAKGPSGGVDIACGSSRWWGGCCALVFVVGCGGERGKGLFSSVCLFLASGRRDGFRGGHGLEKSGIWDTIQQGR